MASMRLSLVLLIAASWAVDGMVVPGRVQMMQIGTTVSLAMITTTVAASSSFLDAGFDNDDKDDNDVGWQV